MAEREPRGFRRSIHRARVDAAGRTRLATVTSQRAQLVNFSRPYYVEGAALMTAPNSKWQTYKDLQAAGKQVRASVLQNVGADDLVR